MYPEYLVYFFIAVIILLIIIKTILFANSTSNKKLVYWFFFTTNSLYNSRSEKTKKSKLIQNRLTIAIGILLFIDAFLIVMIHSMQ